MIYRPDIDGLRAFAVLSVVLCHAGLGMPGGYVGVDVFFVISGYLITRLMLKDIQAGTFSLVDFWERRIRRILPALSVVVGGSFVAGWFLLVPSEYHAFSRSVINLAILQANIFFSHEVGYFAPTADEKPLLHTWSLAVEEQFYLFVPLLVWGTLRLHGRKLLVASVALLMVPSFIACVQGTLTADQSTYYLLTTRAWELFCGVAVALLSGRRQFAGRWQRESAAALGLLGIVVPCLLFDHATPFPGWAATAPVLGTALLIYLGERSDGATSIHRLLANKPLVGIGLISYSLYLWHWPLLVFLKRRNIVELTLPERWSVVGASLILALLTYRFVERPFRRRDFVASRKLVFGGAAAAFACLMIGGQVVRLGGGFPQRLPEQARLMAATANMDQRFLRDHSAADVPTNLLQLGAGAEARLLVWGDSHAMAVLPAIDELCRTTNLKARCAVHSGWPPVLNPSARSVALHVDRATAFSAAVVENLEASESEIESVVLVAAWSHYARDPDFVASLVRTVERLRAAGLRVYFCKDVPQFPFDVAAALTRRAWSNRDASSLAISAEECEAQNPLYRELLPQLVALGVVVLDPIPYLRGGGNATIRAFDADGSFYRDSGHLSTHGAQVVMPTFAVVIEALEHTNGQATTTARAPARPEASPDSERNLRIRR